MIESQLFTLHCDRHWGDTGGTKHKDFYPCVADVGWGTEMSEEKRQDQKMKK